MYMLSECNEANGWLVGWLVGWFDLILDAMVVESNSDSMTLD